MQVDKPTYHHVVYIYATNDSYMFTEHPEKHLKLTFEEAKDFVVHLGVPLTIFGDIFCHRVGIEMAATCRKILCKEDLDEVFRSRVAKVLQLAERAGERNVRFSSSREDEYGNSPPAFGSLEDAQRTYKEAHGEECAKLAKLIEQSKEIDEASRKRSN